MSLTKSSKVATVKNFRKSAEKGVDLKKGMHTILIIYSVCIIFLWGLFILI